MSTGSHRSCEICGVRERHCVKPLSFARFPLDPNRCKLWVKAVGKEDLLYIPIEKLNQLKTICGNHFQKKDFKKKGNRLKKTAIPKLNLSAPSLPDCLLMEFPLHVGQQCPTQSGNDTPSVIAVDVDVPSTSQQVPQNKSTAEYSIQKAVDCDLLSIPSTSKQNMSVTDTPSVMAVDVDVPSTSQRDLPSTPSMSKQNMSVTETRPTMSCDNSSQISKSCARGDKRKFSEIENADLSSSKKYIDMVLKTSSKCSVKSASKCFRLVDKIQSPILKEMVINACKNQRRKATGRRWTNLHKVAMLGLYKRSPKTYRHLSEMMPLPSEKTLQSILKKVPMVPGLSQTALTHLRKQSERTDLKNKQCCLLFDEMSLKRRLIYNESLDVVEGFEDYGQDFGRTGEMADHALVIMLQGLCTKFKQPLSLYFVKGTISSQKLAQILKKTIQEINSTGYQVISTVCDQGPTNLGALKLLRDGSGPRDSDNYFVVDGKKVVIIYDVPHLFKSIRNNFHKNGTIVLNNRQAQWSHIKKVEEKNRNFLYLSKISPTHVEPKYRAKMKVKYAAQVLSNTVSAVLKLLSEAEKNSELAEKLLESAHVTEELDHLFDVTNGPASPDDIKRGQRENVSQKTGHMVKWADWIRKLSSLKFVKNSTEARNVKCVDGYIMTLKSLRDVWPYLNQLGFKYLNLRQLNQDALENLFGVIRQHGATNRNPTCAHFMAAMKTAIVTKMTAHHSRGSNCQKDRNALLTDFQALVFGDSGNLKSNTEEMGTSATTADIEIPSTDPSINDSIPQMMIPDENDTSVAEDLAEVSEQATVYVSGYMASRILKNLSCEACQKNLCVDEPTAAMYSYIRLREWWKNKLSLTYPTIPLCNTIQTAVSVFEKEICPVLHVPCTSQMAVTIFITKCDIKWFSCPIHSSNIINLLFAPLSKLLIRRQCQRINRSIAMEEERMADTNKKAQQMGVAK